jgi:hypothetical protein
MLSAIGLIPFAQRALISLNKTSYILPKKTALRFYKNGRNYMMLAF